MGSNIDVRKIWQPRYYDKKVLVKKSWVKLGWNYITFTNDCGLGEYPSLGMTGKTYRFLGERVFCTCSTYYNPDTFQYCYEIPLEFLEEVAIPA